jgi:hypothetical protein
LFLPVVVWALFLTLALNASLAAAQADLPNWDVVPSPNQGNRQNVLKGISAVSASDIWAVGEYNPGVPPTETGRRTLTQHWDGATWQIVPSPNPSWPGLDLATLEDVVALSANDVWAVGYSEDFASLRLNTLTMHWDGASWTVIRSPDPAGFNLPNQLFAVAAVSPTNVWAVGEMGLDNQALILRWDGTRWRAVRNACGTGLKGITAVSANDIWAVGDSTTCHFDGRRWRIVPSPQPRPDLDEIAYPLEDISAVSANDIWTVGARVIDNVYYLTYVSIFEHWDGSQWTLMDDPLGQILYGVEAVAANDVWAVGTTGAEALIVHWDGVAWSSVPTPSPGNGSALRAVEALSTPDLMAAEAPYAADLWAVGSYFASTEQTLVLHAPEP